MSSSIQSKAIVGTALATGVVAAGAFYAYKKLSADTPPEKWKCVGKVSDLNLFPIKSCAPIKERTLECSVLGFQHGIITDRVMMIVTVEHQCVTARVHPKIVLIQPRVDGNLLIISAPDRVDIAVDIEKLKTKPTDYAVVWSQKVDAVDAGDEVAEWISQYVLGTDVGLRLVFYPRSSSMRSVRKAVPKYKRASDSDGGAMHDLTSYMLINQASIDDLNTHIDHVVPAQQFRPNIVVKGPKAFEEDKWNWVRIGEKVVFRNVKPCTRCIFTNIDPVTGQRNPNQQPLKTLKQYRNIIPDEPPVMGIHISLRDAGSISIGDDVYVEAD